MVLFNVNRIMLRLGLLLYLLSNGWSVLIKFVCIGMLWFLLWLNCVKSWLLWFLNELGWICIIMLFFIFIFVNLVSICVLNSFCFLVLLFLFFILLNKVIYLVLFKLVVFVVGCLWFVVVVLCFLKMVCCVWIVFR